MPARVPLPSRNNDIIVDAFGKRWVCLALDGEGLPAWLPPSCIGFAISESLSGLRSSTPIGCATSSETPPPANKLGGACTGGDAKCTSDGVVGDDVDEALGFRFLKKEPKALRLTLRSREPVLVPRWCVFPPR